MRVSIYFLIKKERKGERRQGKEGGRKEEKKKQNTFKYVLFGTPANFFALCLTFPHSLILVLLQTVLDSLFGFSEVNWLLLPCSTGKKQTKKIIKVHKSFTNQYVNCIFGLFSHVYLREFHSEYALIWYTECWNSCNFLLERDWWKTIWSDHGQLLQRSHLLQLLHQQNLATV